MSKKRKKKRGQRSSVFTPEVLAAIPAWSELATRQEIAEVLGTTVGSLEVTCHHHGISLTAARFLRHGVTIEQWAKLRAEAELRGMTALQLITSVVGGVVDNGLFAAVLGDYDDDHE